MQRASTPTFTTWSTSALTVSATEFYRQLCSVLGIEPRGGKPGMFRTIHGQILYLYKDKKLSLNSPSNNRTLLSL